MSTPIVFPPELFETGKRVKGIARLASLCACGYRLLDAPIGQEYTLYLWTLQSAVFQCGGCELQQAIHVLLAEREGLPRGYLPLACFFDELPRG